jgi:hypothetical protein
MRDGGVVVAGSTLTVAELLAKPGTIQPIHGRAVLADASRLPS